MRLLILLVVLGLVATACGSATDTSPESAPDAEGAEPARLVSPTESADPFDLSGGASSSDADVRAITGDARDQLGLDAASISGRWNTDWSRATVPLGEFAAGLRGSDPRDGIPPIDTPKFEDVTGAAQWLGANEPGALVSVGDEVRFYPLSILTRHEIVNDRFGDVPVAITFCPLCNTALAFDRRVDGQVLRFGVSGLLRKSDLVMWDDVTESLWQQISGEAVVGALAGTVLHVVSTSIVSFADFAETHPDGLSLSRDTGFGVNYGANPYEGYSSQNGPFSSFFRDELDPRFPALERVVAVTIDDDIVAYPFSVMAEQGAVNDVVGGQPIVVFWGGTTTDALDRSSIADSQQIGSGIAYDPSVDGEPLTFVANGDDTYSDAQTGSTWNLLGRATAGELEGTQLATANHRNEFWFAFAGFFPEARVYGES